MSVLTDRHTDTDYSIPTHIDMHTWIQAFPPTDTETKIQVFPNTMQTQIRAFLHTDIQA